ncbi:MAG: DUF5615 family PIN-like protein [Candidatus Competibacteraceae bacterium]|nr:DUF5615 family PIN-like protein [Candidatus Competibacteraceae bacterium]
MRLLINENIPLASVAALREAGHDVVSITERSHGISDESVMAIAHAKHRIVVSFDRDYGELTFHRRLPMPSGVLYLRVLPVSALEPAAYLDRLISAGIELEGKFTTGDREQVRQRPLRHGET